MGLNILVTGGAGYVGSHACKALARAGFTPVAFDDLRRGNAWAVKWGPLVQAELEDRSALVDTIKAYDIQAVMHFAAYAYVGESMVNPGIYFRNNLAGSNSLMAAMAETGVRSLILSSTCAVYGVPETMPITETTPTRPINPYGASKLMMEEMARWYGQIHQIRHVALRYFNAAGADPEGEIGEHHEPEPHLIPLVVEAALGRRESIQINGTDYATQDGTAVRDYVHVTDLAEAHVAALGYLQQGQPSDVFNLGTGRGVSVREVIEAVSRAAGTPPRVIEGARRSGDPAALVADPEKARRHLGWQAKRSDIDQIATDAVQWHRSGLAR